MAFTQVSAVVWDWVSAAQETSNVIASNGIFFIAHLGCGSSFDGVRIRKENHCGDDQGLAATLIASYLLERSGPH
jgi:hypothetical protein